MKKPKNWARHVRNVRRIMRVCSDITVTVADPFNLQERERINQAVGIVKRATEVDLDMLRSRSRVKPHRKCQRTSRTVAATGEMLG